MSTKKPTAWAEWHVACSEQAKDVSEVAFFNGPLAFVKLIFSGNDLINQ